MSYSKHTRDIIKLITVNDGFPGAIAGSGKFRVQTYPGDVDLMEKIDDIYDHLIAIAMIQKNVPEANIVPNGHIFSKKHADLIENTKIPTVRLHSMNSIDLFLD